MIPEHRSNEAYAILSTRPSGLTQPEATERLARFGPNSIRAPSGTPLWIKFAKNFTHLMAILLWVGGVVALLARLPQLAAAIWIVNLINGAFSFLQEYRAERATDALRRMLPHIAHVIRDGRDQSLDAESLVPGDVILLGAGDRIPADGRLVEAAGLQVDQSALTGESQAVTKSGDAPPLPHTTGADAPHLVFAGTNVVAGSARAIVTATGMATEFGRIAELTRSIEEEASPLQKELSHATRVVTVLVIGVGVIFFVIAAALAGVTLPESAIFALGMIVAFVPEGMLPTVTLSLALAVQRMARRNALVKRLSVVETLGCTTVICTDKTGTVTRNEMTVREIWTGGRRYSVSGAGYDPHGSILEHGHPAAIPAGGDLRRTLAAGSLCNNASLLPPEPGSSAWKVIGDPTEAGLLVAALKGGIDLEDEAARAPRLREFPFEPQRERMSTLHRDGISLTAYVKGAPHAVIDLCARARIGGTERPMDSALRTKLLGANDDFARRGLRVIAMAENRLQGLVENAPTDAVETNLTFLGLVGMQDPPRPEVPDAVRRCHRAGIRVMMITGDYGLTALNIGEQIGLARDHAIRILTGPDLDAMDDEALRKALHEDVLFARATPAHKLRIVEALTELGHIVAVTGDGVNDAPALRKAHIGVAMGVAGTDVAKEAADMVLADDNFASIVNAVEEGRAVYANIKKFITYIFTSNAAEATPFILFALSRARIPLALNVMQVLAVDLGTDIMPALALGAEPPEPGVMDRPPRSLKEHVITPSILTRAYLWLGIPQSIAAMAAFYWMFWTNGYWGQWVDLPRSGHLYQAAMTMALACVVTTQIGNLFTQRSERISSFRLDPRSNPLLWAGVATELALIAAIVYAAPFQWMFGTTAIPLKYWAFLFAWTPLLVLVDEFRKAIGRARARARA